MNAIVKCKCAVAHVSEENEWTQAVRYRSYTYERFQGTDGRTYNRNASFFCLTCRTYFKIADVRGKYSAKHECGAKCLNSKGPSCECSCKGKNHGRGYA